MHFHINFRVRCKIIALSLLLGFPLIQNLKILDSKKTRVSKNTISALHSIIKDQFAPNTNEVILAAHVKHIKLKGLVNDLLTILLKDLPDIKIKIENNLTRREIKSTIKYSFIIVDGLEALNELHPFALAKNNDLMEVYLVYLVQIEQCANATIEITNILDYFWHGYTTDVSLLYEVEEHQMVLYTYYPFFDEQHCKQIVVKKINSFNGTWKHSLATNSYPAKLHNLNNCSLVVAIWDTPPYLTYRPQKNGFDRVTDFEGILLIEFAKKLNFSLDYIVPPNDEQRGKRFSNGSTNGAMKLLKERKADMSLGSFRYTLERCEELTGALPYYQSWTVYAVLLMQPYSSLEILGFAFDTNTWLCLLISLCFTLILTYILHRHIKKSWLARIILGIPRPQTPLTNLVSVFLGVPITPMPSSTYTRFVIIHWFIYGLLIRTAYQSLLFQLLQTDMYQEPPKTLSDLISRQYTLIVTTTAFDQVKRVPHIDEADIIFNNSTFEPDTFAIVAENSNKRLAGVSPMDFLKFYVVKNNERGIFFVLPEKIFTQHITMYFTKHTYLIDRFNYIFMQLRSQGLIDYWASKSIEKVKWPSKKTDSASAISWEQINGIFVIYTALLIISFTTFLAEIIYYRYKQK